MPTRSTRFPASGGILRHVRAPRLLTPHPGEMERLSPQKDRSRAEWSASFVAENPVTLLLKGARTLVGEKDQSCYNTTGHPGMASGGMGDVLTGVCAAIAAQLPDKSLYKTGILGSWICGHAAEIAIFHGGRSQESLRASDIVANLGASFSDLRRGVY